MTHLDELTDALAPGSVCAPGTPAYDEATSPDNSSFAQRPLAVVRPRDAAEVATAVRVAREHGLRVAVQATGHGSGEPLGDDVVLVDTSTLQSVRIDAAELVAHVGAGAQWAQVQEAAHRHGLLGLAGTSPSVGVTGYTVNGGVGWLVRPHGLASASLRAVDFVDGSGRLVHADETSEPEALWAFRGGAPVGVATELHLDLYAAPDVWAGYLLWPAEHLPALARVWLDEVAAAPATLTSTLALLGVPPQGPFPPELLGQVVVHLSYASLDGEAGLAGMRRALTAVAAPAVDTTGPADPATLAAIHLDPPVAVPARGDGMWLGPVRADDVTRIFEAAAIGQPGGLNMIELRHVAPPAGAPEPPVGALTTTPAPYLLHQVGAAPDDAARAAVDDRLALVAAAAAPVAVGIAAPGFREGQPDAGPAHGPDVLERLVAARDHHDPERVLAFQRTAAP